MSAKLILYSKPGCHLCEGLEEKLAQVQQLDFELEIRDITTRDDWFLAYQYEIPVLVLERGEGRGERGEEWGVGSRESGVGSQNSKLETQTSNSHSSSLISLPRLSPRATVSQLEQMLRKYL